MLLLKIGQKTLSRASDFHALHCVGLQNHILGLTAHIGLVNFSTVSIIGRFVLIVFFVTVSKIITDDLVLENLLP